MREVTLRITDVSKIYGSQATRIIAVQHATAEFHAGSVTAVMGPSGSGKTTLLSILGMILKPNEGRVEILGEDITKHDETLLPAMRRRLIGFIFQAFNLFRALTALENVMLPLQLKGVPRSEAPERARTALDRVGLTARADFLPRDLSGGEKQRVSIARAVAADTPILLADEPTGNLDSKTGLGIIQLLSELAREKRKTVVIVTHDIRLQQQVDRVLWMEDGRLNEL
jgi:putative ABC transport system ATP-binding protein